MKKHLKVIASLTNNFQSTGYNKKVVALAVKIVSRIAQHERKGVIMVTKKVRCLYGHYEQIKSVTYNRSLKYKPYAQAGVVLDDKDVTLVSYESPIIRLHCDAIEFFNTAPNCSRTTISHVSAFLKEYAPNISYYQVKKAYYKDTHIEWHIVDDNLVHPLTGEVV